MSARISVQSVYAELRKQAGRALVAAAITLSTEHQRRLNVSNPRPYLTPSKPGQYPRKRTGFLQANVVYTPTSPTEVGAQGFVDVGLAQNAFYGDVLSDKHGRLGIQDTLNDLRPQLEALIARLSQSGAKT